MFINSNETDIVNKLGPFAWLAIAVGTVETLIVVKFGRGLFPKAWPRNTLLAWGASGGVFAAGHGVLERAALPALAAAETEG